MACCLSDSGDSEILLPALDSQLDISGSQARMLQHMAKGAGMMPYASAKDKCVELTEFTVCLSYFLGSGVLAALGAHNEYM